MYSSYSCLFLGCDTVSRVHSIGKGDEYFNKIMGNEEYLQYLAKFNEEDADQGDIADCGEKLLCLFYSGHVNQSLNNLRYTTFCKKGSTGKNAVTPESLPSTSNAALYHSYRAYHQVQIWKLRRLSPLKWGFKVQRDRLLPIPMDIAPAPLELLKIFRRGCMGVCNNSRCTCVKHGLKCTQVCGNCRGVSCENSEPINLEFEDQFSNEQ